MDPLNSQAAQDQPLQPTQAFSLNEMVEMLSRDRRTILLTFAISFALVVLAAVLTPSRYVSEASLLVRLGQEYVYVAEASNSSGAMPLSFSRDEALNAETEILYSRDLIGQAVTRLGAGRLYPRLAKADSTRKASQTELATDQFRKNFEAELPAKSTVLRLQFSHADPKMAQLALRTLVDTYLDRRRAIFSDAHVQFLSGQVAEASKRLQAAEAKLGQFKYTHGIVNYDQQISLLLQQVNDLEMRLNDSSQQVETAHARARKLREIAKRTPEQVVVYSETLGDPQTPRQLLELRLKEQGLSARYLDDNPLVQDARKDVATAENYLRQQERSPPKNVRTARNQVLDQAQLDLLRAATEGSALAGGSLAIQQRLQLLKHKAEALSEQQARLNALSLDRKLLEESYGNYARKLENARIDEAREQKVRTNVSVLQGASLPIESKSFRKLILAVGFAGSLVLALVAAFLSEALRTSFLSARQLERGLGIPVLVTLPRVSRS